MTATDLAIINFKPNKLVDAATLSLIRSHAQQSVQDRKLLGTISPHASVETKAKPEQHCFQYVFNKGSGKEVKRTPRRRGHTADRRSRRRHEDQDDTTPFSQPPPMTKLCRGNADPFDVFPVVIDNEFLKCFEDYYRHWRWYQPRDVLFEEIVCHPAAYHSFLAIALDVWQGNESEGLVHENKTVVCLQKYIPQLRYTPEDEQPALACALMWAIVRLAAIKINHGQYEALEYHLGAVGSIFYHQSHEWRMGSYSPHLLSCIASLISGNFLRSMGIARSHHIKHGFNTTTCVSEISPYGFVVPGTSMLHDRSLQSLIPSNIADGVLALHALYNTCDAFALEQELPDPLPDYGRRYLEGVKIAVRLANMDCTSHFTLHTSSSLETTLAECVLLTSMLVVWGFGRTIADQIEPMTAAQEYTRTHLTSDFICQILSEVEDSWAIHELILWVLVVCGSTSGANGDKEHFSSLVRIFFPHAVGWPFAKIRALGKRLPWFDSELHTPVNEFWDMVTGQQIGEMVETGPSHQCPPPIFSGLIALTHVGLMGQSETLQSVGEVSRSAE